MWEGGGEGGESREESEGGEGGGAGRRVRVGRGVEQGGE